MLTFRGTILCIHSSGDCLVQVYEVTGRKKCVCFLGRFEEYWPVTAVEGRKEDGAFTMPQGVESSKNGLFRGPSL